MAKTKKKQEDYPAELQQSFERWEHLRVDGGSDPLWSDGSNMNLVRNHILIAKRRIEGIFSLAPNFRPFRATPDVHPCRHSLAGAFKFAAST